MKPPSSRWPVVVIYLAIAFLNPLRAGSAELFSLVASNRVQAPGGNGDSWSAIMTPDGRFVLFASMADNLVTVSNLPMPLNVPPKLNVFLRDRTDLTTALVSLNTNRSGGGNGGSFPAGISSDGNLALFESDSQNLFGGDTTNFANIFLRNLSGASNILVSKNILGGFANGDSYSSTMTPDGRFIAYVSAASDIVPGDTNNIPDIFVYDAVNGSNILVSVGARDPRTLFGNLKSGSSESPKISADGRFVAFYSTATNLDAGPATIGEVYVRDISASMTYRASADARNLLKTFRGSTNGVSFNHSLCADGHYVVFETCLVSNATPYTTGLVLRYDIQSGITELVCTNAYAPPRPFENIDNLSTTPDARFVAFMANSNSFAGDTSWIQVWDAQTGIATIVSTNRNNVIVPKTLCEKPQLSVDGRFVSFFSSNTNMVTNSVVGDFHLYQRDLLTGILKLLDVDTNNVGSPINPETLVATSTNGQFVAFDSASGKLAPSGPIPHSDVFVRDTVSNTADLISVKLTSLRSRSPNDASRLADFPLSADASFVAFSSDADNLAANDTNRCRDVFVRNMLTGSNILVSVTTNGAVGNGISAEPCISGDGCYVAFTSAATNLVSRDFNNYPDIFLRDLQSGTTRLVSTNAGAILLICSAPQISRDGNYVLYRARTAAGSDNLYWRDMQTNSAIPLTTNGVADSTMTPDGKFVAFISKSPANLVLWSSQTQTATNLATASSLRGIGISADGNRIAYWANGFYVIDRSTQTKTQIGPIQFSATESHQGIRFSSTGRWLVYALTNQVMVYDAQSGAVRLVSHSLDSDSTPGSDRSNWPDISADGRWITYCSAATNLVSGDDNGVPDVFIYDQQSGRNVLLSASFNSPGSAGNRSLSPQFSPNGNLLVFQSWASNLATNDLNRSSDLFAYGLLYLNITSGIPGQSAWLSWPFRPDKSYQAQFKTNLFSANWLPLNGATTNIASWKFLEDTNALGAARFYRVTEF